MLNREIAIYKNLISYGNIISFLTYGNRDDLQFQDQLGKIKILCNSYNLPKNIYVKTLHLLHWRSLKGCDIIKSNQTNGSEIAIKASKFWNKPFIGRMGYILSETQMKRKGKDSYSYKYSIEIERRLVKESDRIVVTTKGMGKKLIDIHNITKHNKIFTIPNYVDTELFSPNYINKEKFFDLIFIGRIEKEKNLISLLKAIKQLKIKLIIIGRGSLKSNLLKKYNSPFIQWVDKVDNQKLPQYLNNAKIYILPSYYEGHPKTLIEALSCGCSVIGANSPGIKNIIENGVNGFLCETNYESIQKKITFLLENPKIRNSIASRAREYAVNRYSLHKITKVEFDLYSRIVNEN